MISLRLGESSNTRESISDGQVRRRATGVHSEDEIGI